MNNRIVKKQNEEWKAIENIIPFIEDTLQIENAMGNAIYKTEGPDFIFYNDSRSIGIEVTKCHPSVQDKNEIYAPALISFEDKICRKFAQNEFLQEITKDNKFNIIIDKGANFKISSKIEDVCNELENHLRAWYTKSRCESNLIKRIRVLTSPPRVINVVQFNAMGRRDPILTSYLTKPIQAKDKKLGKEYKKRSACDEYWLCIYLPFEEYRQSNCVCRDNEFDEILEKSKFDRICLTSVMPNDISWLKGDPNV